MGTEVDNYCKHRSSEKLRTWWNWLPTDVIDYIGLCRQCGSIVFYSTGSNTYFKGVVWPPVVIPKCYMTTAMLMPGVRIWRPHGRGYSIRRFVDDTTLYGDTYSFNLGEIFRMLTEDWGKR